MLPNIRLLLEACKSLNLDYEIVHPNENVIQVNLDKPYFFVHGQTPMLTGDIERILQDKDYTYHILKDKRLMPKTSSYVDPYHPNYKNHVTYKTIPEIVSDIKDTFNLPVIIKRNTGTHGVNVFLCNQTSEIEKSLDKIFDMHNKDYDRVSLAQQAIDIEIEYRAIFLNQSLVLLYEKNIKTANFVGNLSPLHWEGARAIHIVDPDIISRIEKFAQPVFEVLPIVYGGFDIALDKSGKLWLIEINSKPAYRIFIRDNPERLVVEVFEKVLQSLMKSD